MNDMIKAGVATIVEKEGITAHYFEGSTDVAFYSTGLTVSMWDATYTPIAAQEMGRYYEYGYKHIPKGASGVVNLHDEAFNLFTAII